MAEPLYEEELLADGRIFSFRFYSTGAEASDRWYEEMKPRFDEFQAAQKPLLVLIGVAPSVNPPSAEALQRVRAIAQKYSDAQGKTAFLVPAGEKVLPTLKGLVEHMMPKNHPGKIFMSKDEAVAWLLSP